MLCGAVRRWLKLVSFFVDVQLKRWGRERECWQFIINYHPESRNSTEFWLIGSLLVSICIQHLPSSNHHYYHDNLIYFTKPLLNDLMQFFLMKFKFSYHISSPLETWDLRHENSRRTHITQSESFKFPKRCLHKLKLKFNFSRLLRRLLSQLSGSLALRKHKYLLLWVYSHNTA